MPIYEYKCRKCKAHTEVLQKITDKPLTKCQKCGGPLEKQWSNTSFQFKGSGWYVTDYAGKKAEAKGEKKDAAEPTAASNKSDGSTAASPASDGKATATKETASKKQPSKNTASSTKSGE